MALADILDDIEAEDDARGYDEDGDEDEVWPA